MENVNQKEIIIIYYSKYGFTKKVAELICQKLGEKADIMEISEINEERLNTYSVIVIGNPIYMFKYPKIVTKFIEKNKIILLKKKMVFFITCTMTSDQIERGLGKQWLVQFVDSEIFTKALFYENLGGERYFEKLNMIDKNILQIGKKMYKEKVNIDDFSRIDLDSIKEFAIKINNL
jgi:menaquinone-dependent protoporphyrinogen IX oxidase